MAAEIELSGLNDLLNKLRQVSDKANRVENAALLAAAEPVQKTASRLAPRSDTPSKPTRSQSWRTGRHLADNIVISKVKKKNGVKYVEIGPTRGDNSAFFYAKFIEWGTSRMPARPFMQPAYEQNKKEILDTISLHLREALGL